MNVHALLDLLLSQWSFEPTVWAGIGITALLYWLGVRYSIRRGIGRRYRWWRSVVFFGGLAAVFIALESPIDYWGAEFFWVHMLQHEILIVAAAPLLLLGAPAMPLWRGVPLQARRVTLRWIMRRTWPRRLWHTLSHWFGNPVVAFILLNGGFALWHVPALYDLALQHEGVHVMEHLTFLGAALLFWAQVIPSLPLKPRMNYVQQALYLFLSALAGNIISSFIVIPTQPLYPYYAALPHPAGTMTALVDQRFGGMLMETAGMVVFFVAIVTVLSLWLQADERQSESEERAHLSRIAKPMGASR